MLGGNSYAHDRADSYNRAHLDTGADLDSHGGTHMDTRANMDTSPHLHTYSCADLDSCAHGDTHGHAYAYRDCHSYCYTATDPDAN